MACELFWEKNGVIEMYSGTVTGPEMSSINNLVAADPRFDDLHWVIADTSNAFSTSEIADHYEEAAAMAHAASLSNNRIAIAVVAPDPELAEIISRFQQHPIPFPFQVFPTMEAARAWVLAAST